MISYEEAESIAKSKIPFNHSIVKMIEKSYGWYFSSQNNDYIQTKNLRYQEVGSGGVIVEKESGKVINFGSAFSSEENFKIYEKGLVGQSDLIILKVRDVNQTVRLLNRLQMTYVEPEFAHGVEWKIPKTYNEKQLRQAVSKLPCIFQNQNFYWRYDEFQKIDDSKCFDYELRKK